MSDTSYSLIKNEDGSFSYGPFMVLAPVYDRDKKKHIFNILRNGCVPIRHDGNFLTLKNSIKKLTEGVEPVEQTEPLVLSEVLEAITPDNNQEQVPSEPCVLIKLANEFLEESRKDLESKETDQKYHTFKNYLDQELKDLRKELSIPMTEETL